MLMDDCLALAAGAWCEEATRNKVMDPELAQAFAKILHKHAEKSGMIQLLQTDLQYAVDFSRQLFANIQNAGGDPKVATSNILKNIFHLPETVPESPLTVRDYQKRVDKLVNDGKSLTEIAQETKTPMDRLIRIIKCKDLDKLSKDV